MICTVTPFEAGYNKSGHALRHHQAPRRFKCCGCLFGETCSAATAALLVMTKDWSAEVTTQLSRLRPHHCNTVQHAAKQQAHQAQGPAYESLLTWSARRRVSPFIGHTLSYTDGGNPAGLCADDVALPSLAALRGSFQQVLRHLQRTHRSHVSVTKTPRENQSKYE